MNVGQLLQKIKDLIAEYRAGNYLAAALVAWEIVQAFLNSIPQQELGKPRRMHTSYSSGFDLEDATFDECIDELEKCCLHPAVSSANATDSVAVGGGGAIIGILLPIILKLVEKWLGA